MTQEYDFHRIANSLGLSIICFILATAFYCQLINHELPCPLCLLQRVCFVGVGLGLCMNLREGTRISHYGFILFSALLGFAIALRQIFLHISPGDIGYGSPLLGLYLYTWSAIVFLIVIGLVAISLLFEQQFCKKKKTLPLTRPAYFLLSLFLLLILFNGISTFLECGPFVCKDNPVHYYLLDTRA